MITLFSYELTYLSFAAFLLTGLLIGMSKTGVHGMNMIAVPLLAATFGGKESSGLMLPMLIMADVFGVAYYHRHAEWKYLVKLFPWAIVGVLLGTWTGNYIDDQLFRTIMGVIIFASLAIMIWLEKVSKDKIPDYWWFAMLLGIAAGFTTMVGNLAGSAMALYLLSMRLPKNEFIGTAAWFFMAINWFKVPFHIWSWETISLHSFLLDLTALPMIGLGAYLGVKMIKKMSDQGFRWFIMIMTAVAAVFMVF
ncbi:sulfite exporter TauE/SafE family protein [Reichenbachiella carrageenanivorans]|uniref:Probable membrane transporter protein n=1 Tax=Reichenbachiella carrageenanivorans TaxID=2979869 RepID=A0ABY6D0A5_9BACT|nr:sulfite exporter TauE/SafE family protein [Reichenbachiella carrageenanivorans]UXX79129.1 sulfite exporter TauE/SafE family protein [Reichenbachiella carrageenanivorans]